jgi:heme/copper-type cytochrome/quinol oxidase subunit 2
MRFFSPCSPLRFHRSTGLLGGIVFCLRFRRGSEADRTPSKMGSIGFEFAWTNIPFILFVGLFFWGANVYFGMSRPPEDVTVSLSCQLGTIV